MTLIIIKILITICCYIEADCISKNDILEKYTVIENAK